MFTNTQQAGKELNARLYMRALKQIRSWSWSRGEKKLIGLSEAEAERPWAGLAEWLRAAHSMLDNKTVELTRNADR